MVFSNGIPYAFEFGYGEDDGRICYMPARETGFYIHMMAARTECPAAELASGGDYGHDDTARNSCGVHAREGF